MSTRSLRIASNERSGRSSAARSPSSQCRFSDRGSARRCAIPSNSRLRSSPVTCVSGFSAASLAVSRPMPQPASRRRVPGRMASARRIARWTTRMPGSRSACSRKRSRSAAGTRPGSWKPACRSRVMPRRRSPPAGFTRSSAGHRSTPVRVRRSCSTTEAGPASGSTIPGSWDSRSNNPGFWDGRWRGFGRTCSTSIDQQGAFRCPGSRLRPRE